MRWWENTRVQAVIVGLVIFVMAIVAIQMVTTILVGQLFSITPAEMNPWQFVALWWTPAPSSMTEISGSDWLHWIIAGLLLAVLLAVVVFAVREGIKYVKNPQNRQGLATTASVRKVIGERALTNPKRAKKLRPMLKNPKIFEVSLPLGVYRGLQLFISVEDPTIIIGPSRSGKGLFIVINWILKAPGAVVATSNKFDNVDLTMRQRERQGSRVWVFAPGLPNGKSRGHVLRWNPIPGCEDEDTLLRRVKLLVPDDAFGSGTTNGGHWDTLGQQLAACLFHAAALGGRTVDHIWEEWVMNPARAKEAVDLIRHDERGIKSLGEHLAMVLQEPAEKRATTWGTLPTTLKFLESLSAREWMKPLPGEEINFGEFVLDKGTLYVCGSKSLPAPYLHVGEALLGELEYHIDLLAQAEMGRVDPPVVFLLDEVANFKYKNLPELISAGGGLGKIAVAVFQSRAQMQQWGTHEEEAMFDAAPAKLILPGGASQKQLEEMSALAGMFIRRRESYSRSSSGLSTQVTPDDRKRTIEPDELRTLGGDKGGYALLFYRRLLPVIVKLKPFTDLPEYKQMMKDAEEIAQANAEVSQYYELLKDRGYVA